MLPCYYNAVVDQNKKEIKGSDKESYGWGEGHNMCPQKEEVWVEGRALTPSLKIKLDPFSLFNLSHTHTHRSIPSHSPRFSSASDFENVSKWPPTPCTVALKAYHFSSKLQYHKSAVPESRFDTLLPIVDWQALNNLWLTLGQVHSSGLAFQTQSLPQSSPCFCVASSL